MRMTRIGNVDSTNVAPVHLGDLTTGDRDGTDGVSPDDVVTGRQREKEGGENRTPIGPAFQDLGMHPYRIVAFRADLDLPATQFWPGRDDQGPNVLPNI